MTYTQVAQLLKQAAAPMGVVAPSYATQRASKPVAPKPPDQAFDRGIQQAQRQQNQQIAAATSKFNSVTGKPGMTQQEASAYLNDPARVQARTQAAAAKRQTSQAHIDETRNRIKADTQARIASYNKTVAKMDARNAKPAAVKPKPEPVPAKRSATQQANVNAALAKAKRDDAAVRAGKFQTRTGYAQIGNDPNQSQNTFGTRKQTQPVSGTMRGTAVAGSRPKPKGQGQGYTDNNGVWHRIA